MNWDWFREDTKCKPWEIKVLNLFAYTGGATLAAAKGVGAKVSYMSMHQRVWRHGARKMRWHPDLKMHQSAGLLDDCV